MVIGARTAAWSKSLPYDAEVEWLRGNGSTYVDTGVFLELTDEIIVECARMDNQNQVIVGARHSAGPDVDGLQIWLNISNGTSTRFDLFCAYNNAVIGNTTSLNNKNIFYKCGSINKQNGTTLTSNGTVVSYTPRYTAYLFALNQQNSPNFISTGKVYGCKIGSKRDFVPVRVGTLGFMYDKVSKTLYGNAADSGNGFPASLVGPDVSAANGGGIS